MRAIPAGAQIRSERYRERDDDVCVAPRKEQFVCTGHKQRPKAGTPSNRRSSHSKFWFQLRLRNDEYQHTAGFQPPVRMFQKHEFQPLIVTLSNFSTIGRIEVKKRKCFCWTTHIQSVRMQRVDSQVRSLFCAIRVMAHRQIVSSSMDSTRLSAGSNESHPETQRLPCTQQGNRLRAQMWH